MNIQTCAPGGVQEIDLIIIGAGPAGLSTAMHLLQRYPTWAERMLLLEKSTHPRHKLCGGGLTRLGLEILRDLGLELPLPLPQARVDDIRLIYRARTVHVTGQPEAAIFQRAELDAYLAGEARRRGAVIHEDEPVKDIEVGGDGVRVTTARREYLAKAVIGADGSNGVSRQALNRFERRSRVARTLEVLSPAMDAAPHFTERFALFDFTPVLNGLQGYFWEFPSWVAGQPTFNRGIYDARMALQQPRARLPDLLHGALASTSPVSEPPRPSGHPIHWFSPRSRLAMPRWLLVGDAAGSDPLFGEGIAPALGYGEVAAAAAQRAFETGDFSFRDYRRMLLTSRVGRYLLIRWAVAWGGYRLSGRRWLMHFLWSFGNLLNRIIPKPPKLY